MRSVLILTFATCLVLARAVMGTTPNTPPDGSTSTQENCLIQSLSFTNGLFIVPAFEPNVFHYQCACQNFGDQFTTVVTPHLMDDGSSAEVTFNGVQINFRSMGNGISNLGTSPNSPLEQSSPLTFQNGWNTIIIGVGCNNRALPYPCYYQYNITCNKPPSGFVVGDPQFVGLRGQSYQVHGVSGEIYNIVSDHDLQYNSRFVFLDSGDCPVVNGKKQKGCWSHPGSYLGELGLKTRAGDKIHLITGAAQTGFTAVEVNGRALAIGETILLADDMGSVSLNTTHLASVVVGAWDFAFENSDMFVNQRVRVSDTRNLRSHGLLGQTWNEKTYPNPIKFIQGEVDDYVIRDNDIFGDTFVFNRFD